MKKSFLTLLISFVAVATIQAQQLSRYELDVNDFKELKIIEGINVNYICNSDSAGRAVFITNDTVASALTFNNTKDRLEIRFFGKRLSNVTIPTVTVYSKFLTKVENNGDSTVRIMSVNPCPEFKARLIGNGRLIVNNIDVTHIDGSIDTGNGQLVLHGKAKSAKLSNTGVGTIQADDLISSETKCILLGSGTIGCQAKKSLHVSGVTSGKIYYRGEPKEIKNRAVGVTLVPLDKEK